MRLHALRVTAAIALPALAVLSLPQDALAHGHGHFAIGFGFYAPFYYPYPGPWPFYGYYPYYGNPPRQLQRAREKGVGALELHVKPGKAEVYVDGRFAGKAEEFDGSPTLLWMKKGAHQVKVTLQGYEAFSEEYSVAAGEVFEVHVKMKK